ncbi:unnamed protein product [Echinostoma caproni]|uniref:Protein IQ-DOMAIN 1-like n=1 Tax=Echinostoma caproni TaxID=27848 RepID=A0A183AXJ8_9TREM|nr:unnamed protein product [Echinostoma caproni]
MVEEVPASIGGHHAASNMPRQSMAVRRASLTLNMLGQRRSLAGSMARAYKLAQYFRIIPCQYTEQVFCFAGCLLKWFKLEAMRQEAFAATTVKTHHADKHVAQSVPGSPETPAQKPSVVEVEDNEPENKQIAASNSNNANPTSSQDDGSQHAAAGVSEDARKPGEPMAVETDQKLSSVVEGSQEVARSHSSEASNVSILLYVANFFQNGNSHTWGSLQSKTIWV